MDLPSLVTKQQDSCLQYVNGDDCSECADGYYNISPENGCIDCECSKEGSESMNCNGQGKCSCIVRLWILLKVIMIIIIIL